MYTLYVGAPNDSHRIDESVLIKIKQTIADYFESYTYVQARGVYDGTEEDVVIITIAEDDRSKVYALGESLRVFLRQDSVAVEHNGVYEKLITE